MIFLDRFQALKEQIDNQPLPNIMWQIRSEMKFQVELHVFFVNPNKKEGGDTIIPASLCTLQILLTGF